ncbi:hypothetical protein [Flavobacterium sp.]|jgi:hypothetical protein|uniref:hypothetical protein n=1 Tax=Flavobacterium sp. TaxID=239 RepID=UPI000ECFF826|nr:hypothetical protein [Flavobacterium sp.]HCQ11756.1 hypothetical protein [Flavobacterium sp.]
MESLHIEFQPKVKEKLLEFLNSFSKNDLKIIEDETSFEATKSFKEHQQRLQLSLERLRSGESKLYDIDELDAMLEKTISKHEH